MARFFYGFPISVGQRIELPRELSRHIMVRRLAKGETITLFNGLGGEYEALITQTERNATAVNIVSFTPREVELPYTLTLAQGLPEAGKMDWIIEKAVELGVSQIVPVAAQRSVVRLSSERAEKRLQRWQSIATSACEQSGRNRLVDIAQPVALDSLLGSLNGRTAILFTPRASQTLPEWLASQKPRDLTVLIGPEGGFSPEEEQAAIGQGAIALAMGPRILRTETAGIAAIAIINAFLENRA